jgi:hypothetical protein
MTIPPLPAVGHGPRFTLDGSDALERRLEWICQDILLRVLKLIPASRLEAVLLGGGYGRGEGGVLQTQEGDRPYNDLEFYVCVNGNQFFRRRQYQTRLHHLAAELTGMIGIDVEFQVISRQCLAQAETSMFYYDLVSGHRWLWGDETMLAACQQLRSAQAIPASEATRLLMNRCTGLLLAAEKLRQTQFDREDADFIGRNIAKAQLALGDAVLTSFGQYDWSCLERGARLNRLLACRKFPWGTAVGRHHVAGVEFKLHPRRAEVRRRELASNHMEVTVLAGEVWLWLENRRLGQDFPTLEAYAWSDVNKCPGTPPWRNRVLNLLAFRSPLCFGRMTSRHPRERLFKALTVLLWKCGEHPGEAIFNRADLRFLQNCLCTTAANRSQLIQAYLKIWKRFQ